MTDIVEFVKPGNSIQAAPVYGTHRKDVTAADAGAPTDRNKGVNTGPWSKANIQVIPTGADDPVVQVLFWSEALGAFVPDHGAGYTFAAKGAGVAWETTVEANGRIIWVQLTGTVATGTSVYVSGSDRSDYAL